MTHPTITSGMPLRHKMLLGVFFAFSGFGLLLGLIIAFVDPDNNSRDETAESAAGASFTPTQSAIPTATATPASRSSATPSAFASSGDQGASAAERTAPAQTWTVTNIVDGDTLDVTRGGTTERVRLVGIDTPERGECGYDEATAHLRQMVGGEQVTLVTAGPNTDDRDQYDRLLRYIDQGDLDAGYEQIDAGLAIARYDSRDGYGAHIREPDYIATDEATGQDYQMPRT